MAKHEKKEHEGKHHHMRKRGGAMPKGEFVEGGGKKKMHHEAHKAGGKVHGHHSEHRPDRRARGGATSDSNPLTTAGKMSSMPFEKKQAPRDDHAEGADRD